MWPAGFRAASSRPLRRQSRARAFAEADAAEPGALAVRAQDHGVTVLEKRPALATRQFERLLSVLREFEQRTRLLRCRTGDRPGTQQVAGLQVAAVHRV